MAGRKKKKNEFPHMMEVVKLTFIFAGVLVIFGVVMYLTLGIGRLGNADAAWRFRKPAVTQPRPGNPSLGQVCPEVYAPVCGTDGKTYSNSCDANRNKVAIECDGRCPCGDKDPFERRSPVVY